MIHPKLKQNEILFAMYTPPQIITSHTISRDRIPDYVKRTGLSYTPSYMDYNHVISLDPNHYTNRVMNRSWEDIERLAQRLTYQYRPGRYTLYYLESRRRRTKGVEVPSHIGRILKDTFNIPFQTTQRQSVMTNTEMMDMLAGSGKVVDGELEENMEMLTSWDLHKDFYDRTMVPTISRGNAVGVSTWTFMVPHFTRYSPNEPERRPEPLFPKQVHWSSEQMQMFARRILEGYSIERFNETLRVHRSSETDRIVNKEVTNARLSSVLNKKESDLILTV